MAELDGLLVAGRDAWQRERWRQAYDALRAADAARPLGTADLRRLADAAYMLGRDEEYVAALDRLHHACLAKGDVPAAVRATFWIGHSLLFRGQGRLAAGWFETGRRLLAESADDCVEHGYLLVPVWLRQMGTGDWEAGLATAAEAGRIAARFADLDLGALARDDQARALVMQGRAEEGLRLADELLVTVASGVLSPVVRGIVYCNTIAFCRDAHQVPAAYAWIDALTAWCASRPEMVAHNGLCLVHRAELLQLRGAWGDAAAEAEKAATRFTQGALNQIATGQARYRQGEVHRLRGDWESAEECFRDAARLGCDPQPGMSLLRWEQGRTAVAAAAIRRSVAEHPEPMPRATLLPAYIRIMLAAGDLEAARTARDQLARIASVHRSDTLTAGVDQASAAVALASGDAEAALRPARSAFRRWAELGAPYEVAEARALVGAACRALGDEEAAALELDAARETFESLGARSALARLGGPGPASSDGLSEREVQVLGLVARGLSNREIAAELTISEHTVARHLQNIFAKIHVGTRSAAGAYAFERGLA